MPNLEKKRSATMRTPSPLNSALESLRAALIALRPAGADGFEGLLATVLSAITKQDFRLASSGLQLGVDGATLAGHNYIAFEGKRYDSDISANDVLGKIPWLIASSSPPDIWVLGATVEANTQMLGTLQVSAAKSGISTLILDWPNAAAVTPLAAACAMALDETVRFLAEKVVDKNVVKGLKSALETIAAAPEFVHASENLRNALSPAHIGVPIALAANATWFREVFSDAEQARMAFGQKLAPDAKWPLATQARDALCDRLIQLLSSPPQGDIAAVLGGEGAGKSWLLAQSWRRMEKAPLTILVPATEFRDEHFGALDDLLITKLIEQTGGHPSDQARNQWKRRLERWRSLPPPDAPYFVLCIDGLNQHSSFEWSRFLGGAAKRLAKIGGLLVVTDRTQHFEGRISDALTVQIERTVVPEWTLEELEAILKSKGIAPAPLSAAVLKTLRNPRVLGIAFELRDRGSIGSFAELSVGRLMFEHIRLGAQGGAALPEEPALFVKRISEHAQEILNRVRSQALEDRLIFESSGGKRFELRPELLAVTAERFFQALPDDPTLYTVNDDGLSFALALGIIDALKKAARNRRDLSEELETLIEPISALDKTAEAVFDAVLISSVDDHCADPICNALLSAYVQLQNVSDDTYSAFAASVRYRPSATMSALERVIRAGNGGARTKWLIAAIRHVRDDPKAWANLSSDLSRWLRTYNLSPELRVFARRGDDPEKYAAEVSRAETGLAETEAALSEAERAFRTEKMMRDDDVDPAIVANAACQILAGTPLAGFAEAFVACALSSALNSGMQSMHDQFQALIRFNAIDWTATREAVLKGSTFLSAADVSRTGKWARVYLLRATATEDDAYCEAALIKELTADREHRPGWRHIENYCSTDPCDPESDKPDNIDATARKFVELDVAALSSNEGVTEDDRFFEDALPGIARFCPEAGLETVRRYAASAEGRSGRFLMFCTTSLEPHSSALDAANVEQLLRVANAHVAPRIKGGSSTEWISSQYALLCAFPHIDGKAQLDALAALPAKNPPLLKLMSTMKDAPPDDLDRALENAIVSGNEDWKLAVLAFARQQSGDISDKSRALIGQLAADEASPVRGEAMGVIAKLGDVALLKKVLDTGWSARDIEGREKGFEVWHGSNLIVRAAMLGLLTVDEALDRISIGAFGVAATQLGADVGLLIAARLGVALNRALGAELPMNAPRAEREIRKESSDYPSFLSLSDDDDDGDDVPIRDAFKRMQESPEAFEERQRQGWDAFFRFEAELTEQKARLIVDDVSSTALAAAIASSASWGIDAATVILGASEGKLHHAQNFGLKLARELSASHPELSKELFERICAMRGFVTVVYRPAGISLEALCAWGGATNPAWDELRVRRLDEAPTDKALALEVLAALTCEKAAVLHDYVVERLARPEPVSVSRALMVLGFSEPSDFADATIARFEHVGGLIGTAAAQARYAYERNVWSKHWYKLMGETNAGEEFWRWSVLLRRVVDGRFTVWQRAPNELSGPFALFGPLLEGEIEKQVKSWGKKREKRLAGVNAPARIFLPSS